MAEFEYAGHPVGDDGWFNPGIAEIMVGQKMRNTVRKIGYIAQALYGARAPRRTGAMAQTLRVTTQLGSGNFGAEPDRWVAVVEAVMPYSAAVEFGKVNNAGNRMNAARGIPNYPRPAVQERPKPGQFPHRWQGRHTFGGDNRRQQSVVAWIESH
ncbi:hypothetical protein [Nocardia brasiliensis]|uniref:hypothetical protein n=1 Tax=Nocardia brasiliensis TaxID=37326 RepID=UPI00245610FD|nr:hypothetical protein [Nocardia brasiliensis]